MDSESLLKDIDPIVSSALDKSLNNKDLNANESV
jgi:hypothetical protein